MQSPTAREKGPGCPSGTWTKDHFSRLFITHLPPCLKQATPGFLHRSVFCRDPSRLGSQQGSQDRAARRVARSTHTRPLKAHNLWFLHHRPGGDNLTPASLTAVLQLHLGHCPLVHLISKAQYSEPHEELSQYRPAAPKTWQTQGRRGGSPGWALIPETPRNKCLLLKCQDSSEQPPFRDIPWHLSDNSVLEDSRWGLTSHPRDTRPPRSAPPGDFCCREVPL